MAEGLQHRLPGDLPGEVGKEVEKKEKKKQFHAEVAENAEVIRNQIESCAVAAGRSRKEEYALLAPMGTGTLRTPEAPSNLAERS